jgi:hypothetical protein
MIAAKLFLGWHLEIGRHIGTAVAGVAVAAAPAFVLYPKMNPGLNKGVHFDKHSEAQYDSARSVYALSGNGLYRQKMLCKGQRGIEGHDRIPAWISLSLLQMFWSCLMAGRLSLIQEV